MKYKFKHRHENIDSFCLKRIHMFVFRGWPVAKVLSIGESLAKVVAEFSPITIFHPVRVFQCLSAKLFSAIHSRFLFSASESFPMFVIKVIFSDSLSLSIFQPVRVFQCLSSKFFFQQFILAFLFFSQ